MPSAGRLPQPAIPSPQILGAHPSPRTSKQLGRVYSPLRTDSRMAQKWRSLYVLPLIVLVCSVAGGFYGPEVQAESAEPSDTAELDQDVANFTKVLALVEQNFAEPVPADKAIYRSEERRV